MTAPTGSPPRRRPRLPNGGAIRCWPPPEGWMGPRGWTLTTRREPADDHGPATGSVRGGAGALRAGDRPGDTRRAGHGDQAVLRLPGPVRRGAEHARLPGLPGPARFAAGAVPGRDRVHDPDWPGAELLDRGVVPVRAEELLLPGHAERLPDPPVRRAAVHRRLA